MREADTREALRRAVADEPAYSYDLDGVVARGRAGRRRHGVRVGSFTAIGVCAVAGAAFVLAPTLLSDASGGRTVAVPGSGGTAANVPPSPADDLHRPPPPVGARPTDPLDQKIGAAVVAASPEDFFLDLTNGESSSGGVDGNADDGGPPGSISVGLSTGSQQLRPCDDAEFVAGASCTERTLANGAVLSQRGLASHDGIESVAVVLTYPDGSGVNAESLNAVYTVLKPGADGDPDILKPELVVTRAHPTYSVAELTAVVLAVDAALS